MGRRAGRVCPRVRVVVRVLGVLAAGIAQLVGWAASGNGLEGEPVTADEGLGLSDEQIRSELRASGQGTRNDCFFLAGLGAVIQADPGVLRHIVSRDGDGWVVRIHENLGRLHPIVVHLSDTEVAADSRGTRDRAGNPTLVSVLECAYRRTVHGLLFTLVGGLPSAGLAALLGHRVRWTIRPRRGWAMIHRGLADDQPVGYAVSTRFGPPFGPDPRDEPYATRVVRRHAYWVRGIDDRGRIILVNTWGNSGSRRGVRMPAEVHLDRQQFCRVIVQTAEFRPSSPTGRPTAPR